MYYCVLLNIDRPANISRFSAYNWTAGYCLHTRTVGLAGLSVRTEAGWLFALSMLSHVNLCSIWRILRPTRELFEIKEKHTIGICCSQGNSEADNVHDESDFDHVHRSHSRGSKSYRKWKLKIRNYNVRGRWRWFILILPRAFCHF